MDIIELENKNTFYFSNATSIVAQVQSTYEIKDLEKEIGVYSATPEFIKKNCGDIANNLLLQVPDDYYQKCEELKLYPNCDIRIHRVYPTDYPAYPGWHCDGEYRETYFSQPDLNKIPVSYHLTATVSSHKDGIPSAQHLDEDFVYKTNRNYNLQLTQE